MPNSNLTPEFLTAALQGLEAQSARLDARIAEVRRVLGARTQEPAAPAEAPKPKRKISAAALKHIVEAQKKRWAAYHQKRAEAAAKAKEPAAATKTPRPRRKLSAAGRRRIAAATKKRWADYRRQKAAAAKRAGKPAVRKKAAPKKAVRKTAAKGKKRAAVKPVKSPVAGEGASE